jgi:LuxR family maltose regulon positive regulatory protein
MGELADVLRQLPEATLEANPTFALALASAAIEVGAVRDATSWTEVALAHADRVPPQFEATFRTAAMVTRLFQARVAGDVEDALQAARAIISVDDDTPVESGTDLDAIALVNLGALELWTGEQEAATRELERGATIAAARSRWYLRVYALSHLAVQAVWTGDMPAATRRAQESLALCDDYGWGGTARAGMAKTVLSVVAMLEGRLDDAVALVDEAIVATAGGRELPLRANTELHRARLLRMRGRTHEALEIIAAVRRDLDGSPFLPPIAGVIQTEDALTHLAAGDRDRAVALLEESVAAGASGESPVALASIRLDEGDVQAALRLVGPWTGPDLGRQMASTHVRALIVAARAQRQLGDREAAFAALERALAIAAPQVRRLPFLEQPPEFADQLREHVGAGSAYAAFATDLHDRLPRGGQAPTADAVVHPREELSARELAVLRFLPTMLTNREIAEELMVSVNTVKTHLKQVYSKLGAHDRRDAVRRARERGLLR